MLPLVGLRVLIQGLSMKPELNGCASLAESYDASVSRYAVRLTARNAQGSSAPVKLRARTLPAESPGVPAPPSTETTGQGAAGEETGEQKAAAVATIDTNLAYPAVLSAGLGGGQTRRFRQGQRVQCTGVAGTNRGADVSAVP